MATYNGAAFVFEQIESILVQLTPNDELVVVDDASTDRTVEIIRSIGDPRIQIHHQARNSGASATFEKALALASGDMVFMADQDDIWPFGRLDVMCDALADSDLVIGTVVLMDDSTPFRPPGTGPWFRLKASDNPSPIRSIALLCFSQLPYHGCAMGMRREFLQRVLPFPKSAHELHDAWVGLVGLSTGRVTHIAQPVVFRRIHHNNLSGHVRGPRRMLYGRWLTICMIGAALRLRRRMRRSPP